MKSLQLTIVYFSRQVESVVRNEREGRVGIHFSTDILVDVVVVNVVASQIVNVVSSTDANLTWSYCVKLPHNFSRVLNEFAGLCMINLFFKLLKIF